MPYKGQGNRVRLLESENGWQWTPLRIVTTESQALPALAIHNGQLIVSTFDV
jgi:hypothetical protein